MPKKKSCNLKSLRFCSIFKPVYAIFRVLAVTVTKLTDKYLHPGKIKETQMNPSHTPYYSQIHHEVISIRSTAYHMLRTMLDISM